MRAAIVSGKIRGWARTRPQRLRWFVYADQLPGAGQVSDAGSEVAALRAEVAELRAEVASLKASGWLDPAAIAQAVHAALGEFRAEVTRTAETASADLRARVVSLTETNLLLMQAQDELGGVAATLQEVAVKHRRALAMFMTPGHPGELEEP